MTNEIEVESKFILEDKNFPHCDSNNKNINYQSISDTSTNCYSNNNTNSMDESYRNYAKFNKPFEIFYQSPDFRKILILNVIIYFFIFILIYYYK